MNEAFVYANMPDLFGILHDQIISSKFQTKMSVVSKKRNHKILGGRYLFRNIHHPFLSLLHNPRCAENGVTTILFEAFAHPPCYMPILPLGGVNRVLAIS